jgi:D-cysteine desulfhydrase
LKPRLSLAHLPTPLEHAPRLAEAMGLDLWIKRDDATGGPEAGNKIRKLEYLLADALERGADCVITCGGLQSNHARATAVLAARLGLGSHLMLRDPALNDPALNDPALSDDADGLPIEMRVDGNLLIDRFVGASIRRITPRTYAKRHDAMGAWADELRAAGKRPYIIGEGGSNGLGALGYVRAMEELRQQLDATDAAAFDLVVHACGSGGTAAGVILGAARYRVAERVVPFAVCDDAETFRARIGAIMQDARGQEDGLESEAAWQVDDGAKGPAYGVSTEDQRSDMLAAARLSGLVTDPVYSGKALHGLWSWARRGGLDGKRVLFIHTGGLPGLLAQAEVFA